MVKRQKAIVSPCSLYDPADPTKSIYRCPKMSQTRDEPKQSGNLAYSCPACPRGDLFREKYLKWWKGLASHYVPTDWVEAMADQSENPVLKIEPQYDWQDYHTTQGDKYYWIARYDENSNMVDLHNIQFENGVPQFNASLLKCDGPYIYGATQAECDATNYPLPFDVVEYEFTEADKGYAYGTEDEINSQCKGYVYKTFFERGSNQHRADYSTVEGERKKCDVSERADRIDGFLRQFSGAVGLYSKYMNSQGVDEFISVLSQRQA